MSRVAIAAALLLPLAVVDDASAHFPWISIEADGDGPAVLKAEFAEGPNDGDPALLRYLDGSSIHRLEWGQTAAKVELVATEQSRTAELEEAEALFVLRKDLGVMSRGGESFFVRYTAYAGRGLDTWSWRGLANDGQDLLGADADLFVVVPEIDNGSLTVTAMFDGEPAPSAEIDVIDAFGAETPIELDAGGVGTYQLDEDEVVAFKAKYVEASAGEYEGDSYDEVRHYMTVTFDPASYRPFSVSKTLPALPELVTSLGAAVSGDRLFVYGGHTGRAHSYYKEAQANTLRSLDLNTGEWAEHGDGEGLQGFAMVAHGGKVYRIGGLQVMNAEGEVNDLQSRAKVEAYDVEADTWSELPPLPERRSSFDAAVLDGAIYVFAGWDLNGESEDAWHQTAWKLDLSDVEAGWQALPEAPFMRRAVSVAAHDGKLYVLGGMQDVGAPTTETAVFDPATGQWADGPKLVGGIMVGFGSSAFASGGRLYASVYDGTLQRLSQDGSEWEVVGDLPEDRFFHRMVAWGDDKLVIVGGASMRSGKFEPVHVLDVGGI